MASETNKTRSVTVIENETYSVIQISNHGRSKNLSSRYPLQRGGRSSHVLMEHTFCRQKKKKRKSLSRMGPKNPELVSLSLSLFSISYYKANRKSVDLSEEKIFI